MLVHAAAARLGLPEQEVVLHFGREAAGIFAVRHPDLFVAHGGTRGFVLHLNDVIHPEVRKLHPGADAPDFGHTVLGPDVVELTYTTRRRLCHLAHGLVEGTARCYGEEVDVTHVTCMHDGADSCRLELRFR